MKYCDNCGKKFIGGEKFCKYCGKKVGKVTDPLIEKAKKYSTAQYSPAVPIYKFVIFSIATFGLYEAVWFYKNWDRLKSAGKVKGNTLLRTIFGVFNMYFLIDGAFSLVKEETDLRNFPSVGLLAFAYFFLVISSRIPVIWLISFFSFLPLIPVQNALNYYYAEKYPDVGPRNNVTFWELVVIILGGCFLFLVLLGTFAGYSNQSTSSASQDSSTNTDTYDTPTPDAAAIEEQYGISFMTNCDTNGTHYTVCSCYLNYLRANYTLAERLQMDIDYNQTKQVPQAITDAYNACTNTNQQ